jgi:type IV pilus assembly protein PilM
VGFELTDEAVRFIELKGSAGHARVVRFDEALIQATEDNEGFLEGDLIKKTVGEFVVKNKLSLVSSALPDEKVYIFKTEVPLEVKENDVRQTIELRLEEFVPVPPKEAIFDIKEIGIEKGDHRDVSVSVIPRLVVDKYLSFCDNSGLKIFSLLPSAQATADAIIKRGDNSAVIIASIGRKKTTISIAQAGTVHFSSTVQIGGSSIVDALSKHLKISTSEAEVLKNEKGVFRDKKNPDLFYSLLTTLSAIKDEITKISEYWNGHMDRYTNERADIKKILICGEEGGIKGLSEYFDASSQVHAELADVWINVLSINSVVPPISKEKSLAYAPVVGLALNELK